MSALYRETRGQGPDLVLLHGWGLNLRVFDALVAQLEGDFRLTLVDLPGHGRSAWQPRFADPAAQLAALLESLPPRAHVLGWSLGGQWALQLAAAARARIAGLVLVATTPRFVVGADWPWGLASAVLAQFAQALQSNYRQTVADFLELQVRGSAAAAQVLRSLTAALREHGDADPRALELGLALLQGNDLRALVPSIEAPALVIGGQHDRITPGAAAEALAALLPRAQALVVPRAGHAPFLSHTDSVARAARRFLAAPMRA
jgi:pimeloyl-[acyl-carrier protein] methyl ester esterase